MMKRLVIFSKNYGYNFTGATMATQKYVERWSTKIDEIVVYTLHKGKCYHRKNIAIRVCGNLLYMILQFYRHERYEIDTTYYSDDHFGFIIATLNKKYIHTYHGNWPDAIHINSMYFIKSFYFIPLYYLTIKYASSVVNVSKYMENFTNKINKNEMLIRNGMDVKEIHETDNKYKDTCLMVGNIDSRKYKYCVRLARYLKQKKSNIKIHIYGKCVEYAVKKELDNYDNVKCMGQVRSVPYNKYNVFLNLSDIENLSISVCEAIYYHLPVICFDVGGLGEVVKNNQTGFIVKKGDIKAVYLALNKIIKEGIVIDTTVLSDFDWDKSAMKYIELFSGSKE